MAITDDERQFMREFYRNLADAPLEPDRDARYVALYQRPDLGMDDPIELLERGVEWSGSSSAQLLSGFRGTGKSTELRRLRDRLRGLGYVVVIADIEDYLNTTVPIDVTDFLMFLAGAFGDALVEEGVLSPTDLDGGFWERAARLARRVEAGELTLSAEAEPEALGTKVGKVGAEFKLGLKEDPSFRAMLQKRLAGHLGSLVKEVHAWFAHCRARVHAARGTGARVALLIDSIEHIRGTWVTANEVQSSVETLFVGHADKLLLPDLHVVYTVPPWLKIRAGGIGTLYGGCQTLPAIKVYEKGSSAPFEPGIQTFEAVVARRGDWQRLLGTRERLVALVTKSGGHLRDLFKLVQEVLLRTSVLPARDHAIESALSAVKRDMLPVADEHATWMAHIIRSQRASLAEAQKLPDLARFLDTHQVLGYRNGDEWFDVHPLIVDEVLAQVADLATRDVTKKG